ncbi:acetolactate synthase large subunit [Rhodopseudomonas palustris]|uniref:Acetolactate synthase large subunit n=1 Tax=Rhodopseudomonas palustris TaxID=1076 RepID=A0AAX3E474_RHOPL|nr:acetolactate synthase large subunit [Rhodopseudomonas palustris]UYO41885.1 acetolactate synthase large subunit [Rhodopseudomonas palustris]
MTVAAPAASAVQSMTGADRLCDALLAHEVDVCFANPGTSEMHFVAALDRQPRMKCILGLFEGVVTGAADGYARMTDRPAVTLLHLGPGLANGLANMHNARRAHSPMINIVGDHAVEHLPLDAPLTSDIDSLARPMSRWVKRIADPVRIDQDVADAWSQSMAPGISTLILPADMAWNEHSYRSPPVRGKRLPQTPLVQETVVRIGAAIRTKRKVVLMLSGGALRERPLRIADNIRRSAGVEIYAQGANGRIARGRGRAPIAKLPMTHEIGLEMLRGADMVVLIGAKEPVSFFAYPNRPGRLAPPNCEIVQLAGPDQDLVQALEWLADEVNAPNEPVAMAPFAVPATTAGANAALTVDMVNRLVAARLPDQAIVCDEALTSSGFFDYSYDAEPHDYLQITGGAIGIGIPMAAGAAVACPDRKVINLQADGSGMYTVQGLWTHARENLDVVTIVFSNRSYATLWGEMSKVGAQTPGRNAQRMLQLDQPELDWTKMSQGLGVEASRATTLAEFSRALDAALARRGPYLIEAMV